MENPGLRLVEQIGEATLRKTGEIGLRHAKENLPLIQKTISDLEREPVLGDGDSAIVVSAGPSLHRRKTAEAIVKKGYKGTLIVADGALGYCLRHGLHPHYVVSVDPDENRIIRWFGDPDLDKRPADDYFRRQDLDPHWAENEKRWNHELIELVDRHGPRMKAIVATSVAHNVARRCKQAKIPMYWWNPIYDDYDDPDSLTRKVYQIAKVPGLVTGGNVGACSWVFAHAVLRKKRIALVGMDFSYHPETKPENTQYYTQFKDIFGDKLKDYFIHVYNPHLKQTWFTDPAYYWYRQNFLELLAQADSTTTNCTEGGILFGEHVKFEPLDKFLDETAHG